MFKAMFVAKAFALVVSLSASVNGGAVLPLTDGDQFTGEYSYYSTITMDEAYQLYGTITQEYVEATDATLAEVLSPNR